MGRVAPTNSDCLSRQSKSRRGPAALVRRINAPALSSAAADGQSLAYVYFEEEAGRRSGAKLLTKDEVRWLAVNFAKLPDLLCRGNKAAKNPLSEPEPTHPLIAPVDPDQSGLMLLAYK